VKEVVLVYESASAALFIHPSSTITDWQVLCWAVNTITDWQALFIHPSSTITDWQVLCWAVNTITDWQASGAVGMIGAVVSW